MKPEPVARSLDDKQLQRSINSVSQFFNRGPAFRHEFPDLQAPLPWTHRDDGHWKKFCPGLGGEDRRFGVGEPDDRRADGLRSLALQALEVYRSLQG